MFKKLNLIFLLLLLNSLVVAEEKTLKFRGVSSSNQKTISIDIEMLEVKKLNKSIESYKKFKSSAKFIDDNFKSGPLFRGGIYGKYVQSVPLIWNEELEAIGAGAVVDNNGTILTNWHVVNKAKTLGVWFKPPRGEKFQDVDPYRAEVLAIDKEKDLALIRVYGASNLKPIPIGSSVKDIEVGDKVHAIGHPEGLMWSYTQGTVSSKRDSYKWKYEKSEHEANLIQTQTPISSGNSGGPLFSESGKLVGINTANHGAGQNLNFAVTIEHGLELIKNPKNKSKSNAPRVKKKKTLPKTGDHNNNGKIDTWFEDSNKNGKIDTAYIDDDENGSIEGMLIDKDEDGKWEILMVDENENGKFDIAFIDEDKDGKHDVIGYDYNEDGEWDKFEKV